MRRHRFDPWARRSLRGGNGNLSSIPAWRIPWKEEPGGLQSKGSQKNWTQLSDWHACTYSVVPVIRTWIYVRDNKLGKFLKRWKYQTTLPASWETCMQVKKQQLEWDMEQQTGSKLGKEYVKAVYCHPAYLTYMHSILFKMLGWMKHKLESRLPGEISVTSGLQMTPPFMAEIKEILKNLLMKVKEESGKAGLKVNIQKIKIMASGSITSWQVDGETMETVTGFLFLGSRITVDGDSSHEIRRCLLLGRKGKTNLDGILKSRDLTLPTKVCVVKATSSRVWMWELEGWVLKNSCFRTVVLEKTSERPLGSKEIKPVNSEGNRPWIFIGRTDTEAETPILCTWCKELTHWKRPWCWERLEAKGEGQQRMQWLDGITSSVDWVWANPGDRQWRTGKPSVLLIMRSQRVTEQQQQHTWGEWGYIISLPNPETLCLIAFLAQFIWETLNEPWVHNNVYTDECILTPS